MTFMAGHQALLMRNSFVDPLGAQVRMLLHFDGSLVDNGLSGSSWSFAGTGSINSTPGVPLSGSGCLECASSTSDGAFVAGIPVNLSTNDFCIENWFYDNGSGAANQGHWTYESVATAQTVRVYGASFSLLADASGGGPSAPEVGYTANVWNHCAVTRNGSNWTLWLNGASVKTWVNSTFNGGTGTSNWYVGRSTGAGSSRRIRHDEFRVTIGNARYTAPFTPAFPFPNP